jgi:hypothetical protein
MGYRRGTMAWRHGAFVWNEREIQMLNASSSTMPIPNISTASATES